MSELRRITERYRLDKLIASSESVSVFRATDLFSGGKAAVKLIGDIDEKSEDQREAFLRLAAQLIQLRHPGVPRVLDCGFSTGGSAFLVTEYVTGASLELLAGSEPARVLKLMLCVLAALQALASLGAGYGNLKLDNVLVVQGTEEDEIKLLGLGSAASLARLATSDLHAVATLTCELLGATYDPASPQAGVELPPRVAALADPEALRAWLENTLRGDAEARPGTLEQARATFEQALGPAPAAGSAENHANEPKPPDRTVLLASLPTAATRPVPPRAAAPAGFTTPRFPANPPDTPLEEEALRGDKTLAIPLGKLPVAPPGYPQNLGQPAIAAPGAAEGLDDPKVRLHDATAPLPRNPAAPAVFPAPAAFAGPAVFATPPEPAGGTPPGTLRLSLASLQAASETVVPLGATETTVLRSSSPGAVALPASEEAAPSARQEAPAGSPAAAKTEQQDQPAPELAERPVPTDTLPFYFPPQTASAAPSPPAPPIAAAALVAPVPPAPPARSGRPSEAPAAISQQRPMPGPASAAQAGTGPTTGRRGPTAASAATTATAATGLGPGPSQRPLPAGAHLRPSSPLAAPSPTPAAPAPPPRRGGSGLGRWLVPLGLGAGLAALGLLATLLWTHRQPAPKPVVRAALPARPLPAAPPPASPPVAPAINLQIELAEADLGSANAKGARDALAEITPEQQAAFSPAERERFDRALAAAGTASREQVAKDLADGLAGGDLGRLNAAVVAAKGLADLSAETRKDLDRARRSVALAARLSRAQRAKSYPDVLASAAELRQELPGYAKAGEAREQAAAALEGQSDAALEAGQADRALSLLEGIRRSWPDRPLLAERFDRITAQRQNDSRLESTLAAAARAEQANQPLQGLDLLAGVKPSGRYAERFRQERAKLEELLARLDSGSPVVALREGFKPEYEKGKSIIVPLRITDDFQVKSVECWMRSEGGSYGSLAVRHGSGSDYEVVIPESLHENKTVELYVVASDPSGHHGVLGSRTQPIKIKRKGWLSRIFSGKSEGR